ncbi:hypothetical protein CYMTET_55552 [Cymbomonas tetramitiformis]|uniref:ABM domain-containing protein n=1 Tax=Cymbomonas tetramitiformis TaxID=36881 RepID=A0AAE0BEH4_9CHLO|nr:hypothetical protein CYMTET_55552 [Cymbomonas tetramitiformis]
MHIFQTAPTICQASNPLNLRSQNKVQGVQRRSHRFCPRSVQTDTDASPSKSSTAVQLPADRYIATNRFKVKNAPAFEKRWCERKSRLAELDGFRFFTLMRRVDTKDEEEVDFNYVSCTVWEDKENFTAWRTGEAFKEAHGGGTLWGFVDMLISSSQTLEGPPKPAFYDGLIPISMETNSESIPETVGGWRKVEADGKTLIPAECYVATNRFKIAEGFGTQFEQRFASRDSILEELPGFRFFSLLRRDAPQGSKGGLHSGASDEGDFNYMTLTVWEDKAAFDNWRDTVKRAKESEGEGGGKKPVGPPQMFLEPPTPAFYEGKLVLATEQGA